jgi:hypothetical protein
VKKIARMATDGERPLRPIKITHIEIRKGGGASNPNATKAVPKAAPGTKRSTTTKKPSQAQQ